MEFIVKSHAKLNMTLEITGIRDDGYHLIESFMVPISLCDELIIRKSDTFSLDCDDPSIPLNQDNILHKAWALFTERYDVKHGFSIFIKKNIPHGAGMGGGSSNAGAFLNFIWDYFKLNRSSPVIMEMALKLGCDVPFFINSQPVIAKGLGEIFSKAPKLPENLYFIIIKPQDSAATSSIYKEYDKEGKKYLNATKIFTHALKSGELTLSSKLYNSLTDAAIKICPSIRDALDSLSFFIPNPSMTGSGSACFAITNDLQIAKNAKEGLKKNFPFSVIAKPI